MEHLENVTVFKYSMKCKNTLLFTVNLTCINTFRVLLYFWKLQVIHEIIVSVQFWKNHVCFIFRSFLNSVNKYYLNSQSCFHFIVEFRPISTTGNGTRKRNCRRRETVVNGKERKASDGTANRQTLTRKNSSSA